MSFTLRPYQVDIIDQARDLMREGRRSILVQSPTGSGKTALTAHMLNTAAQKRMSSFFTVHRRELINQSIKTFAQVGIRFGVVAANYHCDLRHLVQICSIQTLARRYQKMRKPRLIVWDECHHIAAGSWAQIHKAYPDAYHIGLTATPERLDGKGLRKWFGDMIKGPTVSWLIENKYLAPYKLYAPASVNLAEVHTRMGDFVQSEVSAIVDKPTITGDAIKHYQRLAPGKRAVVFCVSIEHSKHVVSQFQAAGITAAHVDGETDVFSRDLAIKRFERGEIQVLSNVELFGEGFDLPAIEVAILLRPTQSLGMYLQQVGRVLRPCEGKEQAIILDHVGNCQRHGLPDEDREWSLDGRDARRRTEDSNAASVRICPKCFAAQMYGVPSCRFCGHVFAVQPRQVDQVDGDLVEVDAATLQRQKRQEQGQAQTFDQLVALGKARGYPRPHAWASHIMKFRQAKRLIAGRAG